MIQTKPIYEVRQISDLRDMLNSSIEIFKDKTLFLVKDETGGPYRPISYEEYGYDVNAFGTALLSMGLRDKKIAVIGENRYEWAVSYMSVVNGVGVIVPFDKELPKEEIEYLVETSGISCIIYTEKYKETFQNLREKAPNITCFINMDLEEDEEKQYSFNKIIERGKQLLSDGNEEYIKAEIDRDAMKILLFTSGTTGMAKGVMLSHNNIATNMMAMCSMVNIVPSDIFFSILPLHHTYECTCGFLTPIYRGASIAYCEGLKYILKNLEEAKPTVFLAVPLIFESIYKKIWRQAKKTGDDKKLAMGIKINSVLNKIGIDLSKKLFHKIHDLMGGNMRLLISGGAAIDPEVVKGYRNMGIPMLQGYGLTECSPIVGLNPDIMPKDAAAGVPLPGVEVKIENPGEDGIGEIIVKAGSVMLGYYNNKEATDKVVIDGWYHTGDLGFIDENNYINITGRKKNVIITKNGKNIFPEELEFYLNRIDFIAESMVWGKMDDATGETYVHAQIRPDSESIEEYFGSQVSDDEIEKLIQDEVDKVNNGLPFYKKIRKIHIKKEEFAKTTSKKIKRHLEIPVN